MKAGRITDAPFVTTGDAASRGPAVAGPKGQISAQGGVMCQQPVFAPVSGTPCLFYELEVTAEWKEGDSTKSKQIDHQKVAAQLAINDGSGPIWVDLREGGDFEPTQKKQVEQSTGLLKGIVGGELTFGNYRLNAGMFSLGTKYRVEEKVLPVQQQLYVCGKLADGGGVITAPKWRNMIVSNLSREQFLGSVTKIAKIALIAGGASMLVGIILAVIAAVTGPSKAELAAQAADASAAAAASASAAAASASAAATDAPSAEPTASATATTHAGTPGKTPVKSTTPAKSTTTTPPKSTTPPKKK